MYVPGNFTGVTGLNIPGGANTTDALSLFAAGIAPVAAKFAVDAMYSIANWTCTPAQSTADNKGETTILDPEIAQACEHKHEPIEPIEPSIFEQNNNKIDSIDNKIRELIAESQKYKDKIPDYKPSLDIAETRCQTMYRALNAYIDHLNYVKGVISESPENIHEFLIFSHSEFLSALKGAEIVKTGNKVQGEIFAKDEFGTSFFRHCESEANAQSLIGIRGSLDKLSKKGKKQAYSMGKKYAIELFSKHQDNDIIIHPQVSTYVRTTETFKNFMKGVFYKLKKEIKTTPLYIKKNIDERDLPDSIEGVWAGHNVYGAFSFLTNPKFRASFPLFQEKNLGNC